MPDATPSAMLGEKIAADVDAILSGDDSSVPPAVKLASELKAAGIDFHLIIDHVGPDADGAGHRHALVLDDAACAQLAERVECAPMGLNLRRAGQALARLGAIMQRDLNVILDPTGAVAEAGGAVLVDVAAERPVPAYGDAEVEQLAAELEAAVERPQDGA